MAVNSGLISPVTTQAGMFVHAWTGLHNIAQITIVTSGLLSAQIQFTESELCPAVKSVSLKCYVVHKFPAWEFFFRENESHFTEGQGGKKEREEGNIIIIFRSQCFEM